MIYPIRKHKFGAKRTECDGIKFDSKLEAKYYNTLKMAQQSGELLFFLRQVPFHLPGNTKYVVDFVEFWKGKNDEPGDIVFTDVKGYMTDLSRIKIAQTEEIYGIEIQIIKKV